MYARMHSVRSRKGFTLYELIAVIAIIAILFYFIGPEARIPWHWPWSAWFDIGLTIPLPILLAVLSYYLTRRVLKGNWKKQLLAVAISWIFSSGVPILVLNLINEDPGNLFLPIALPMAIYLSDWFVSYLSTPISVEKNATPQ